VAPPRFPSPSPGRATDPPIDSARRASETLPTRFSVALGPAFALSAGGLGANAGASIAADVLPTTRLGFTAFVFAPISAATGSSAGGTAAVRVAFAGLGAIVDPRVRFLEPIGAGALLALFHADGAGSSTRYSGTSVNAFSAGPYLRAGLRLRVASFAFVSASATTGALLSRFELDLAKQKIATWGLPFVIGMAGFTLGNVDRREAAP
jgi:hypothetical protein